MDDLIISSPYESLGDFDNVDDGLICIISGQDFPQFSTVNNKYLCSDCISSSVKKSLFGKKVKVFDLNGDKFSDALISAPRNSLMVPFGGTVKLFNSIMR